MTDIPPTLKNKLVLFLFFSFCRYLSSLVHHSGSLAVVRRRHSPTQRRSSGDPHKSGDLLSPSPTSFVFACTEPICVANRWTKTSPLLLTIDASPEWWEEKIKENKDYAKFRNADLSLFDEKYAFLFRDSVAVGDQTMTPLQFQNNSNPNGENVEGKGDSDDINLDDDVEPLFPSFHESSSSKKKRSKHVSNNRSTKSKSSVFEEKVDALLDAISTKSTQTYPQNNPSPTIADCMAIVTKFPDFREGSNEFSQALFVFTKKQKREAFMFPTTDEAKMGMDSDESNSSNDNEEWWVEEDRQFKMLCGLALKGIILARNVRMPCHTSDRTGNMFINEVLNGHPRRCYEMFRLHVPVFRQLCADLATNYGLQQTRNISIEESVGIFLMTLAHGCSNRFVQEFFNHSGETIHRHFHTVLKAVLKLSANIIKPDANYNDDVPEYILNNPRKFGRFDEAFNRAQQESYNPIRSDTSSEVYEEGPSTRRTSGDDLYMAAIRDIIAQDINILRRRM
ncbi:unnamed protein product [Lactuca saligna]|uniref:DUF8040 domain-containing protein n=1 Tax=Lactuca saligna TaxID=75948 RepID=A0AA35YP86_LACSI|nr:unnamed protein product [Lactuca saligna]